MRRLGLIGGSGWPSTLEYYRLLNTFYGDLHGRAHAMDMVIRNIDFEIFRELLEDGQRESAIKMIVDGINDCEKAGAQFFSFSANGLHRFLSEMEGSISLPCVHIADPTANAVKQKNIEVVGLLGVRGTMESDFYPSRLSTVGVKTIVPEEQDKELIDRIIFGELVQNKFTAETKRTFLEVMNRLKSAGAEGVILGCTEIPLLVSQADFELPLFSTTEIHCRAILDFAMRQY